MLALHALVMVTVHVTLPLSSLTISTTIRVLRNSSRAETSMHEVCFALFLMAMGRLLLTLWQHHFRHDLQELLVEGLAMFAVVPK